MTMTDPIADLLTRIRNAIMAKRAATAAAAATVVAAAAAVSVPAALAPINRFRPSAQPELNS